MASKSEQMQVDGLDALGLGLDDGGQPMYIQHPGTREYIQDEDGKYAYIRLLSMDSEHGQKIQRRQQQRRLKQLNKQGQRTNIDAQTLEDEVVELLAELTQEWHLVTPQGKAMDLPCNKDKAKEVYAHPQAKWIRDQVNTFVADLENFTGS